MVNIISFIMFHLPYNLDTHTFSKKPSLEVIIFMEHLGKLIKNPIKSTTSEKHIQFQVRNVDEKSPWTDEIKKE